MILRNFFRQELKPQQLHDFFSICKKRGRNLIQMKETKKHDKWGLELPEWNLDIPDWDIELPQWDLKIPNWNLELPEWNIDLPEWDISITD
jgi:hypothetical protein